MKRICFTLLSLALLLSLSYPAFAEGSNRADAPGTVGKAFVIDNGELLSQAECARLEQMASEISQRQHCDVVILTENGISGKTPQDYADDYFDGNGYGQGVDRSGILLLLEMYEGDWHISTRGDCLQAFTDDGILYLWSSCKSSIKRGSYADGIEAYLQRADTMLSAYNGTLSEKELNSFQRDFNAFVSGRPSTSKTSFFALGIGLVLGFLPAAALKAQLKSVRSNYSAANYKRPNSLRLDVSRDIYLYTNTTSRVIETQRSSGGGSSSHISSSGATHGGRGGKI